MTPRPRLASAGFALLLAVGLAPADCWAQQVISLEPQAHNPLGVSTPPSVDNGIADGVVKTPGAPSVGDGRANGVVKKSGAPSVGDGIANGVVKSTTVNQ